MIERLMNQELRYGEPEFSKAEDKILKLQQELSTLLSEDGQRLLSQLTDEYIHQGNIMMNDVFIAGFCAAVEVMLDFLHHKTRI